MQKIYLAFLGMGGKNGYEETVYTLDGKCAIKTRFVQAAEIELIGRDYFDRVIIVVTENSKNLNYEGLIEAFKAIQMNTDIVDDPPVIISEDMSAKGQWTWFEEILKRIQKGDELTVDLTHGYRSIPIVFSTAIYFLQKARDVRLKAVYYGAYEQDKQNPPIIDMKEFYLINEWAEGVSRLVEDADARKIAELSRESSGFDVKVLNNPELVQALNDLTDVIRNVDIHNVSEKVRRVLCLIADRTSGVSSAENMLLELLEGKFLSMSTTAPINGYSRDYFLIQLEIIHLLLDHRLFMQAFTVMREMIGSIGLIGEKKKIFSSAGKSLRRKADIFLAMLSYDQETWKFRDGNESTVDALRPMFDQMVSYGIEPELRSFTRDLTRYRNGFDHAWTSTNGALQDIQDKGYAFYRNMESVINSLIEREMI